MARTMSSAGCSVRKPAMIYACLLVLVAVSLLPSYAMAARILSQDSVRPKVLLSDIVTAKDQAASRAVGASDGSIPTTPVTNAFIITSGIDNILFPRQTAARYNKYKNP
eukprot:gene8977-16113_t